MSEETVEFDQPMRVVVKDFCMISDELGKPTPFIPDGKECNLDASSGVVRKPEDLVQALVTVLRDARASGFNLTVDNFSPEPYAMGNHHPVVAIVEMRHSYAEVRKALDAYYANKK